MKAVVVEEAYKSGEFKAEKAKIRTDFPIPEPQDGNFLYFGRFDQNQEKFLSNCTLQH